MTEKHSTAEKNKPLISTCQPYLTLHGEEVFLRAGHLHRHVIPGIPELGGVWNGDVPISKEVRLEGEKARGGDRRMILQVPVVVVV